MNPHVQPQACSHSSLPRQYSPTILYVLDPCTADHDSVCRFAIHPDSIIRSFRNVELVTPYVLNVKRSHSWRHWELFNCWDWKPGPLQTSSIFWNVWTTAITKFKMPSTELRVGDKCPFSAKNILPPTWSNCVPANLERMTLTPGLPTNSWCGFPTNKTRVPGCLAHVLRVHKSYL